MNRYVICGIPGTGKTTLSKMLSEKYDLQYISDWHLLENTKLEFKKIIEFVNNNQNFVLDLDYRNYKKILDFSSIKNLEVVYLIFDSSLSLELLKKVFKNEKSDEEIKNYIELSLKYKLFCTNHNSKYDEINKNRDTLLKNILKSL